ncbi:MAG: Peptidase M23 family protein [Candidatus Magasanikbacteria bacterium GW2011_GWA2_46_17]|uniref:Peptidase M23 family protein n=1 Tax=Candidatus Magasanikbacteria bacterium GW2011_GWA2_46_17 TaxID=1619042 RepID=A0A0G1P1Q8_9BACT|nr:MAG: Peptidase M23 family protein [Candidatus Magasanikbacteria bacterium GW2011_GWA2_46_17]
MSVIKTLFYARVVIALVVIGMPSSASAGIFSFVTDMFASKPEEQMASVITSQNIPLLQAALNPDPNYAKGGGDITIVGDTALLPETGPSGTMVDIEENHSDQISLYVVRDGDTLSEIAKMFRVSVNTIIWANDVSPKTIRPGEQLIILPISGIQHTVKKGDTLKAVATKYKVDVREITQFNNLQADSLLAVGDTIIIPDGEVALAKAVSPTSSTAKLRGVGGPNYDGYYTRPVLAARKTQGLHGYNGIDLASYVGAPILAAAGGEVIIAKDSGWNGGYGNYIVITHNNGTQTLYGHLQSLIVYSGKYVVRGEVIGYMGSTGRSTGSHLHFEIRGAKNPF